MKYSKILLCFGALWASSAFPAPAPCDTLRVAFLTDIHVTPGNTQDSLLRIAIDEINASTCDIVLLGGDLTNLGSDAELKYVHGLISRLEKPWHAVPGNHETTWSESACTTFARIFGHDGRTAFRAGDYLFLGYASGPFMKMAMGAVRTEDLAWLAAEAAKARPGQRIVSLCHYPLNNDLTNRTEVTATLRRLGIPLTLFSQVGCMVPRESLQKGRFLCSRACILLDAERPELPCTTLQSGIYACMYRQYVSMDNAAESVGLQLLMDYIAENGYQIVGPYLGQVIAETSVFNYSNRNILVKQQIPVALPD